VVDVGEIGVGLVGYKFMGRAHSNAYRQVGRFFDLELSPRMRAICGRDEGAVRDAAASLGWESYETDYRRQTVLDAVERSVESRSWTREPPYAPASYRLKSAKIQHST
jgi:hypothetical protein